MTFTGDAGITVDGVDELIDRARRARLDLDSAMLKVAEPEMGKWGAKALELVEKYGQHKRVLRRAVGDFAYSGGRITRTSIQVQATFGGNALPYSHGANTSMLIGPSEFGAYPGWRYRSTSGRLLQRRLKKLKGKGTGGVRRIAPGEFEAYGAFARAFAPSTVAPWQRFSAGGWFIYPAGRKVASDVIHVIIGAVYGELRSAYEGPRDVGWVNVNAGRIRRGSR